jgi:hypothetical protein
MAASFKQGLKEAGYAEGENGFPRDAIHKLTEGRKSDKCIRAFSNIRFNTALRPTQVRALMPS